MITILISGENKENFWGFFQILEEKKNIQELQNIFLFGLKGQTNLVHSSLLLKLVLLLHAKQHRYRQPTL